MASCYAAPKNAKLPYLFFAGSTAVELKVKVFTLLEQHDLISLHCLWIKAYQAESRMAEGRAKQS